MKQIFQIWPDIGTLAGDLDLPYQTVASWRRRGIPANRYPEIIEAARQRGHDLTYEKLIEASRTQTPDAHTPDAHSTTHGAEGEAA